MAKKTDSEGEMPESTSSPDINPWEVLARLTTALEKVAGQQAQAPTEGLGELQTRLTAALERLAEANIEGSKLIADETRRAHRPSNEVVPGNSVFNRRGNLLPDAATGPRKQPLKCIMMLPWLAEWESLTREEVDLLNLLDAGEYMLKRIDNSKVRVTISVEYKVDGRTPSRLLMNHDTAFNNDNFRLMPALPDMLRQLLKQHDRPVAAQAASILSDEEEEALIEAGELSVSV